MFGLSIINIVHKLIQSLGYHPCLGVGVALILLTLGSVLIVFGVRSVFRRLIADSAGPIFVGQSAVIVGGLCGVAGSELVISATTIIAFALM